jgi:hypothetical protein
MLLIHTHRARTGNRRGRHLRAALVTLAIAAVFTACLDERDTYVVDHMPDCMLGCQERCLSQHVGACQMACEDSWSWSLGLNLPVCGFEWEAVDENCRGPGAGCLEVYGPKLGTSEAADEVLCGQSVATWETCMAGSNVLDCRWQCQGSCDAKGLESCEAACEGNWSWIDRLGSGLCLATRNAVDAACGEQRQCSAEGPIFSTDAITQDCTGALNAWRSCYQGLN